MSYDPMTSESCAKPVWEAPYLDSIDITEKTKMMMGVDFDAVDFPGS